MCAVWLGVVRNQMGLNFLVELAKTSAFILPWLARIYRTIRRGFSSAVSWDEYSMNFLLRLVGG